MEYEHSRVDSQRPVFSFYSLLFGVYRQLYIVPLCVCVCGGGGGGGEREGERERENNVPVMCGRQLNSSSIIMLMNLLNMSVFKVCILLLVVVLLLLTM